MQSADQTTTDKLPLARALFTTRTEPLTPQEAAAIIRARNPQAVSAVLQELYRLAIAGQQTEAGAADDDTTRAA